jgi:hypothetical protein
MGKILMCVLMFSRMGVVTTDQPKQFLRVHLVAVTIACILLRHRAMGTAISGRVGL